MITNEAEIRVALQVVLASVLASYGFWGWALLVLAILLPWKPLFAVGSYLAQPLVDWRIKKARERHEKGMAQIEQELDAFLRTPRKAPSASAAAPVATTTALMNPSPSPIPQPLEPFKPNLTAGPVRKGIPQTAQNLSATLEIPPVIKNHVQTLPQGVFNNMDLEVEEVNFHGDTAEACVRFRSPNVTELVIRQRYVLRKSGDHWEVESPQPANGTSEAPPHSLPTARPTLRPP